MDLILIWINWIFLIFILTGWTDWLRHAHFFLSLHWSVSQHAAAIHNTPPDGLSDVSPRSASTLWFTEDLERSISHLHQPPASSHCWSTDTEVLILKSDTRAQDGSYSPDRVAAQSQPSLCESSPTHILSLHLHLQSETQRTETRRRDSDQMKTRHHILQTVWI